MSETNGIIPNKEGYQAEPGGFFAKGNPGKPKGAVVKVSVKVRESIVNFLEANIETIQADFDKLKPRERLQFFAEILPYAAPKLSSIQTEVNANHTGGITVRWEDPGAGRNKGSNGVVQSIPAGLPDHS